MSPSTTVLRRSTPVAAALLLRRCVPSPPSQHRLPQNHQFLFPEPCLSRWTIPSTPEEAQAKLAMLRRDYWRKVREVRKECIRAMDMMRMEKARRDEAKEEEIRIKREERARVTAQEGKVKAQEREIADNEFRGLLLKERTKKLKNWGIKIKTGETKRSEACDLFRHKSSLWMRLNLIRRSWNP